MEYSSDPILLRTMEFERAPNSMGLKRLIAGYLSVWKHEVNQPRLQPVCTIPEVQGNGDNLFTKLNPKKSLACLAYLGCLQDIWLCMVQVTEARLVYVSVCMGKNIVQTGPTLEKQGLYSFTSIYSPTCTKVHLETFCSSSSLGEKPATTHRCHHEEETGFNSNLVSLCCLRSVLDHAPYFSSSYFFSCIH